MYRQIIIIFIILSNCSCGSGNKLNFQTSPSIQSFKSFEGHWRTTITSWNSPDSPPKTTHGSSIQSLLPLSGLIIEKNFTPELSPASQDAALFGFDPDRESYVAFWRDPFTRRIGISEGKHGNIENTLILSGTIIDPISKLETPSLVQAQIIDLNRRILSVFARSNTGKLFKTLEILYYR